MLNIRLSRVGKKGYAQYRIVVAEKSSPIKGRFVEQLGSYNPHNKELVVKKDRIEYWISSGASCSDTVNNLLIEKGIIKGDKVTMTFKKKVDENAEGEEKNEDKTKGEDTDNKEKAEDTDKKEESKVDNKKDAEVKEEEKTEESKEKESGDKKEEGK